MTKCVLTPKDHFERHSYFPHFRGGGWRKCGKNPHFLFLFWRLPLYWSWKVAGWWWVVHLDYNVSSGPFLTMNFELDQDHGPRPGPGLDNLIYRLHFLRRMISKIAAVNKPGTLTWFRMWSKYSFHILSTLHMLIIILILIDQFCWIAVLLSCKVFNFC